MVRVEHAADHLDVLPLLAQLQWQEWSDGDPNGSVESWAAAMQLRVNRDCVPLTLLAFDGDELVGGVSLVEHDMPSRQDLADRSPWVAGAYVIPSRRNRGIGTLLMTRVAEEAARLGIRRIYLYTSSAESLYARLGWRREQESFYEGETLAIMSLELQRTHV